MKFRTLCSSLLASVLIAASCNAEVAVIVNPANDTALSTDEISGIFLAKMKSFPNGNTAIPVNQPTDSDIAQTFNEKVINKTSKQLKAYWSKLVFTGQGTPPKELGSDSEIIKLVADNPNIIGYVDSSAVTSEVKVIATF